MPNAMKTQEMLLAIQNANERQRIKSMLIELAVKTQNLTKKDIGTWRKAWQMAINAENPRRVRLYEVYTDVDADMHLTGAISQRKNMVLKKAFRLVDASGKEVRQATELLETEWFKDFMNHALDSQFWGHSLIQFGDIITLGGKRMFEQLSLVPRQHVVPELGIILRNTDDDLIKGISYRNSNLANWCIEAGKPNNLGLLLKCAPHALSKKNMMAFWDGFGELFGMPMRIGKTISRDPNEISKIEQMLGDMGAAAWGLFPEGTEIDIKESSRGDAFNVYDQRIIRCNSEMSKGILNQTMTIDDGASLSQSQVHMQIFQNIIEADADMLRDLINNRLLPFMLMHGFQVQGLRFEWDDSIDYSPEQQKNIEQMLLDAGYEIAPAYFIEKYNIPVGARKTDPAAFFF
jgi:phage gp29-like protein